MYNSTIPDSIDFSELTKALSFQSTETPFLNIFQLQNNQYNLLKVDILTGVYQDIDGEISLRPTPGLFLRSAPNPRNLNMPFGEIIFLPGIFNPASSDDCSSSSMFTPGIMAPVIECFKMSNLNPDSTEYLNKFSPMKLAFNLNGFLFPGKIIPDQNVANKLFTLKPSDSNWATYPMLTVLNTKPEDMNFIKTNDKFMSNLFSPGQLDKVIREQKFLDTLNLASTQIISSPTVLAIKDQGIFNYQCLGVTLGFYLNPQGVQFYDLNVPNNQANLLPFIIYDKFGNPISNFVVQDAIKRYCLQYQGRFNIISFMTDISHFDYS